MKILDFRSDTVTQPTPAMRQAMYQAQVGDDVYRDDPTMLALEQTAAQMLGKEAALFIPSGTMGNQLAVMTHTQRGDEILLESHCHILEHEVGACAVLSGVQTRALYGEKGVLDPADIRRAIRDESDIHYPPTGLLCLENALSNGRVIPTAHLSSLAFAAQEASIPVHLDGARIFNAATALGVSACEIAACADSVMFCLSKGLCAPVGSMLCGSEEFIKRARKGRKLLGGGMRQSGFLAAAGLVALKEMTGRLLEDHQNARYLAQRLEEFPTLQVRQDQLAINLVFFSVADATAPDLVGPLSQAGILINGPENSLYRFVTHHGIERADIDRLIAEMQEIL